LKDWSDEPLIKLTEHAEGVILPVRAQAGGSKNSIRGEQNGMLKVSVTQIAEKGKANKSLAETIAKGLGLKKSQVELIAGEAQPQKKFLIRDIAHADLQKRLAEALLGNAP
jgi:uncharacterized protein (TIGR00251 family)